MSTKREDIRYYEPRMMFAPKDRELHDVVDEIIAGNLAGIALRDTRPARFLRKRSAIADARVEAKLRSEGFTNAGDCVKFHQRPVLEDLQNTAPGSKLVKYVLKELWAEGNITGLHADQAEDVTLPSIIRLERGAMRLDIFRRGEEIADKDCSELFGELRSDTVRALVDRQVDPARLHRAVTRLEISQPGDVIVFNSQHPHMAISLGSERRVSTSRFFDRPYED